MKLRAVAATSLLIGLPAASALYYHPRGPRPIGEFGDAPLDPRLAADWLRPRQGGNSATGSSSSGDGPSSTSSHSTEASSTSPTPTSETSPSETPTSTTAGPTSTPTTAPVNTQTTPPPSKTAVSTNAAGSTVFIVVPVSDTPTSSSATPSATAPAKGDDGLGAKSIAGLVVVSVLLVLGIGGFIWWKLSKKRFSGFDDDDAIKWPDLNDTTAMQPLPSRTDNDSQSELTKVPVVPYHDQSANASAVDLSKGPMQHAPESGYYGAAQGYPNDTASTDGGHRNSGYYDPYSGPVPQAFTPQGGVYPDAGRRSPGPNAAYEGGAPYGRSPSPGPNMAYAPRAGSPGPGPGGYAPRAASPGPNMAYGGPRAASPGPNMAYGGGYGRAPSPGPNMAYAPRAPSPGPNQALGGRAPSPGPNQALGGYQ